MTDPETYEVDPEDMPYLEEVILSGAPVNPEDYDPLRKRAWEDAIAAGLPTPPRYPDSIHVPCEACGITIQIGPRQQQAMKDHADKRILKYCLFDAALYARSNVPADEAVPVVNLNNPYQEPK